MRKKELSGFRHNASLIGRHLQPCTFSYNKGNEEKEEDSPWFKGQDILFNSEMNQRGPYDPRCFPEQLDEKNETISELKETINDLKDTIAGLRGNTG